MFLRNIVKWTLAAALAVSGTAPLAVHADMKPAKATANPFTASLQIAADQRDSLTGQFLDLQAPLAPLFDGRTVPEVAVALGEVLQLDDAARAQKLDIHAIAQELELGSEIALSFSANQMQRITRSAPNLRDGDLVVIVLASDRATRTVSVRHATMRNTVIYP